MKYKIMTLATLAIENEIEAKSEEDAKAIAYEVVKKSISCSNPKYQEFENIYEMYLEGTDE